MSREHMKRIKRLKAALLEYLGANGRHYGDLTRVEQGVQDLSQALYTKLDQLLMCIEEGCTEVPEGETPRQRLASRFFESGNKLLKGGNVDAETADQFEKTLELLDVSADLRRQADTVQDAAETAAIKHKRGR